MAEGSEPLLGYVAHVVEGGSYHGGLLAVTLEGDPVDFVYSAPLSLTHLQRILLGKRADAYVIAKVLAVPLFEKVQEKPVILLFEEPSLLGRTVSLRTPAAVLAPSTAASKKGEWQWTPDGNAPESGAWLQAASAAQTAALLKKARAVMAPIDLKEPFRQVRDAIAEMRKEAQHR
jgi:hypothetical protein